MIFFKPEDISKILQINTDMVIDLLEKKELIGVKINDIWRIKKEYFELCINSHSSMTSTRDKSKFKNVVGKYSNLYNFFVQSSDNIELSFEEIEKINKFSLPDSARKHRPWWGNDSTHSQALSWLNAGYKVNFVDTNAGLVKFIKID